MSESDSLTLHREREGAVRMLRAGFTVPVAAAVTNVPVAQLKKLNYSIHGRASPPGMLPETRRLCRTGAMGLEVSLLIDVYRAKMRLEGRGERDSAGPEELVWSLERYREVRREAQLRQHCDPLNPSQVYVVLRDWQAGQMLIHKCRSCGFHSYHHDAMDPFCYPCVSEGTERKR